MAEVIITKALKEEMLRRFRQQAIDLFEQFKTLESNPQKGKAVGNVGGIVIKELRCDKHRFYFITDGHILKFGTPEELASLLIKFVRMSEKKDQQEIIDNIKRILASMGLEGF